MFPAYCFPCKSVTRVTDFLEIMITGKTNNGGYPPPLREGCTMSQLTLAKPLIPAREVIPLSLSKESVTINIHISRFAPEHEGEPFTVDSSSITIRRAQCISSADYIRDIVQVFRERGARFDATGNDWAQCEPYVDPYTGIMSSASVCFDSEPDWDLFHMVTILTDATESL